MFNKAHVRILIALVWLCTAAAQTAKGGVNEWTTQGPNGGQVMALVIDSSAPSTLYAGARAVGNRGGGVFKTLDGGASWTRMAVGSGPISVHSLAIDPEDPSIVYCGAFGGKVYKSTDGGANWSEHDVSVSFDTVEALAIDPHTSSTLYAGSRFGGVFKSTDGGELWTAINDGLGPYAVEALAIDPSDPSTLYAGTVGGIYRSTDGGGHWSASNSGLTELGTRALAIDPDAPQTLYAGGSGVYKSTDGGGLWTAVNEGLAEDGDPQPIASLAIDPMTPSTLYAGAIFGPGGLYKSIDGGVTWAAVAGPLAVGDSGLQDPDVRALAVDPANPDVVYAGTTDFLEFSYFSAGVYKSMDGGIAWTVANAGLSSTLVLDLAIDPTEPSILYSGILDGGLGFSADGGASWTQASLIDRSITELAVDPQVPSTLYAAVEDFTNLVFEAMKSTDGGATWAYAGLSPHRFSDLLIDPLAPSTLYAVTIDLGFAGSGELYKSTDGAASWSSLAGGLLDAPVTVLAIDPSAPATLYAATAEGEVLKSVDGGASWILAGAGLEGRQVAALAVDPAESSIVYAATDEGVFNSTDGGASWFSAGLAEAVLTAIAIDPIEPANLYAATDLGVFRSPDGGSSWTPLNAGLETLEARQLVIDPSNPETLYAATDNGVFEITQVEPCVADPTTLCIDDQPGDQRFEVTLHYASTLGGGIEGDAVPTSLEPLGIASGGILYFFDADNPEVLVKVLDGCAINNRFWVFAAATTTVGFTLTVEDTHTGLRKEYTNPDLKTATTVTDTDAFAACGPDIAAASSASSRIDLSAQGPAASTRPLRLLAGSEKSECVADGTTLCIDDEPGDQRFEVALHYASALGGGIEGDAVPTSLTPLGTTSGGILHFFDAANPEVLIKVLDGCEINQRFWVFFAAATTVGFELTVEDTVAGVTRTYVNPDLQAAEPVADTAAFATCEASVAGDADLQPPL